MVEDIREKVVSFVKKNGPVLPVQISGYINMDLILSSAILSELVARKQLRVTSANIGSSPLYYLPGQEYMLGPKLYNYLRSKEKEAYDLLRDKKIIEDEKAEPWQRVAFRQLKDFCFPIHLTIKDKTYIFWRFYLVSEDEAKNIIINSLQPEKTERKKETASEQSNLIQINQEGLKLDKNEVKEVTKKTIEIKEEIKENKKEKQKKEKKKEIKIESDFYNLILKYLKNNKIYILEENIIRKNREYEFIVSFPSALGNLKYFIKAKNKKSINDAEIVLAHSQSQEKKFPCLFLTTGNITKKAKELIEKKLSGQLIVKQV